MRSARLAGRACDARAGIRIGFLVRRGFEQESGWWHDVITPQSEERSVGDETRGSEVRGVCLEVRNGLCQEEGAGRAEGCPGGGRLAVVFRDPGVGGAWVSQPLSVLRSRSTRGFRCP